MIMKTPSILVIDDEPVILETICADLQDVGYQTKAAADGSIGLELMGNHNFDLLITDLIMENMGGFEMMEKALETNPDLPVIIMSGYGTVSLAVKAMNAGAYWFLEKPYPNDLFLNIINQAIKRDPKTPKFNQNKCDFLSTCLQTKTIIGNSSSTIELKRNAYNISQSDAHILIEGETGTGKDLIARFIHQNSKRSNERFVAINCASFPESLAESELFGHEAGSFTGADQRQIGKFEFANKGTIFLDEINSMSLGMQAKILRVLEENTLQRVGSNQNIAINVRVLAATQVDLEEASNQGKFRADLFYRLNVGHIKVPPLREHLEDIPLLFANFVDILSGKYQCAPPEVSTELLQSFMAKDWPGNIREFKNEVEKLFLLESSKALYSEDHKNQFIDNVEKGNINLAQRVSGFEKALIESTLKHHKGNIKKTQEALSIPRPTLNDKLKKYGLKRNDFL
jgi:two-component system, NtrC family, C4-dicarboxylate transport response regulator DctD